MTGLRRRHEDKQAWLISRTFLYSQGRMEMRLGQYTGSLSDCEFYPKQKGLASFQRLWGSLWILNKSRDTCRRAFGGRAFQQKCAAETVKWQQENDSGSGLTRVNFSPRSLPCIKAILTLQQCVTYLSQPHFTVTYIHSSALLLGYKHWRKIN